MQDARARLRPYKASKGVMQPLFVHIDAFELSLAGNDGELRRSTCTMGSPAIAKNVLAVGASTSGDTRLSVTAGLGIDTVAVFSSYGPTSDSRIKPEVLAPGDTVSDQRTPE